MGLQLVDVALSLLPSTMRHGSRRLNTTTQTTTSYERPPSSEVFGCAVAIGDLQPVYVDGLCPDYNDYNHHHGHAYDSAGHDHDIHSCRGGPSDTGEVHRNGHIPADLRGRSCDPGDRGRHDCDREFRRNG